jgi:peptidoglycan/xylan/chitin deacetylase (PgdA/CDA1 family)
MAKKTMLITFLLTIVFAAVGIVHIYGNKNNHEAESTPPEAMGKNLPGTASPGPEPSAAVTPSAKGAVQGSQASLAPIPVKQDLPILMYHCIDEKPWGLEQLFVRTSEFEKQIKFLSENGYTPILFEDLKTYESYQKPIIITFDDGYRDNYTHAYPILKKYNYKAVIFLIVNYLGSPSYLTTGQIQEMGDRISFQSHTVSHIELDKAGEKTVEEECRASKKKIEEITGKPVNTLCYPCGLYKQNTISIASRYYDYAVTTKPGYYNRSSDNYQIRRIRIQRSDTLKEFAAKLR